MGGRDAPAGECLIRRYRVLHLMTLFETASGAAENTKLTLNGLDRTRFEPFLGTQPSPAEHSADMDGELAGDVRRVPLRWLTRAINPLVDATAFVEMLRVMRRYRFDVVHTHNAKDGILGRWAAFATGVPAIVHTVHNVSFQAATNRFVRAQYALQERWAARITGRILAVSKENIRKYLVQGIGLPEQYRTVYSGLDLARYAPDGRTPAELRAALGLPDRAGPWVGWVGRFSPQKDPVTFLRAAREVAQAVPGVQFVVCGDDHIDIPMERDPRLMVQDLGLDQAVHFLGFRRDIANVFRAVDVVMHSSRYEGMGRVVCEAMACGRPVAGTAVDGVVEAIVSGERGGILVPPGDHRALALAALQLLQNGNLARGLADAGRRWVECNLSHKHMVSGIEATYMELLNRAHLGAEPMGANNGD